VTPNPVLVVPALVVGSLVTVAYWLYGRSRSLMEVLR